MILMPDLFSFAYVPNWYSQLDMLAERWPCRNRGDLKTIYT